VSAPVSVVGPAAVSAVAGGMRGGREGAVGVAQGSHALREAQYAAHLVVHVFLRHLAGAYGFEQCVTL
jgi:hypothetical protein